MISISHELAIFENPIRADAMKARMLAMSMEFLLGASKKGHKVIFPQKMMNDDVLSYILTFSTKALLS